MRRLSVVLWLAATAAACGADQPTSSPVAVVATNRATRSPGSGAAPPPPQEAAAADPEPPGAQKLAEEVLTKPWNRDKTSRLKMTITSLVDRTTGISGFKSGLAQKEAPLKDRLARLGAETSPAETRIRLAGAVLFDFDSADIRADAAGILDEVAGVLEQLEPRPARIEGHTDSIASDAYNQALSQQRAEAVRSWLKSHGVDGGRLTAEGHGESRPVADNDTAAGRQSNRRVEIVIAGGS